MKTIEKKIKITYDETVDAGYIYMQDVLDGEVDHSEAFIIESNDCHLVVDLDKDGKIIGFEILGMKKISKEVMDEFNKV